MVINFVKYQGTGNDFVVIDNRSGELKLKTSDIPKLCDRKMGVGADGVIVIQEHNELDFHMVYYNSDGSQSLCGNGSRCAVHYAKALGMITGEKTTFLSTDGPHTAFIAGDIVRLQLADVENQKTYEDSDMFIDTGSPHHIRFVSHADSCDVFNEGREIRKDVIYQPNGTNVNFVEVLDNHSIYVRTYERGVEDETLSCGTGVTAAALAASTKQLSSPVNIKTLGGNLKVSFEKNGSNKFTSVFLIGPAVKVFEGKVIL